MKNIIAVILFTLTGAAGATETFRCAAGAYQKQIGEHGDQCTLYVRAETDIPWAHCNNSAYTCYNRLIQNGYAGGSVPERSAVVVFDRDTTDPVHGHIGIVEDIDGDRILVRDSNWNLDRTVREHWMSSTDGVIGYVYCDGTPPTETEDLLEQICGSGGSCNISKQTYSDGTVGGWYPAGDCSQAEKWFTLGDVDGEIAPINSRTLGETCQCY